jgi:ribonuclease HII
MPEIIVGIDEVGRGPWAGPMVVGAVVLASPIDGLRDSKKLSKARRIQLDKIIRSQAVSLGLGWVSAAEIDAHGLTWAQTAGALRALGGIKCEYNHIVIDGKINYLDDNHMVNTMVNHMDNVKIEVIVKADDLVPAVSAASIIAKVARDDFMTELAYKYPQYGFESHVGYGTTAHRLAIEKYGLTEAHRRSFAPIKRILELTK